MESKKSPVELTGFVTEAAAPDPRQPSSNAGKLAAALETSQDKDRESTRATALEMAKIQVAGAAEMVKLQSEVDSQRRKELFAFWGPVIVSMIGLVTAMVGATAGIIAAWRGGHIIQNQVVQDQNIRGYVKHVNSMKDELVAEVRKNAFTAGEAAEKAKK